MGWTAPDPDGIEIYQGGAVDRTTPMAGAVQCRLLPSVWISRNVFQIHAIDSERQGIPPPRAAFFSMV